jgi:excisionase family DNA binding protein
MEHTGAQMAQMDERITLSVKEVAQATGASEQTVRRRIADGEIPAIRLGSRVLIVAQPFLDRVLDGLQDTRNADPENARADAESARLSHATTESKAEWLARLSTAERAAYDKECEPALADAEHRRQTGRQAIYA